MTTTPNTPEQPPEQLTLDRPYDLDDRETRLRAELDRLDMAKTHARIDALNRVSGAAERIREETQELDASVVDARGYGATWQQVADAAGLVKSAAWERWAHRA